MIPPVLDIGAAFLGALIGVGLGLFGTLAALSWVRGVRAYSVPSAELVRAMREEAER